METRTYKVSMGYKDVVKEKEGDLIQITKEQREVIYDYIIQHFNVFKLPLVSTYESDGSYHNWYPTQQAFWDGLRLTVNMNIDNSISKYICGDAMDLIIDDMSKDYKTIKLDREGIMSLSQKVIKDLVNDWNELNNLL